MGEDGPRQIPQASLHRVRACVAASDEHAKEDARDVGVEYRGALAEREAADRARGVLADALEREQRVFVLWKLSAVRRDGLARD